LRTVHSPTPWWKRAVFYEIYVRSFQDTDGDGVGDLAGIVDRLDYLNDGTPASLGVDALWLTPINPSPMADFGYDVSDYCDVDPLFGSLDDLDRLIAAAHRRGMRVILDLVPNHTSDRHPWFIEARASRQSPRRDWYIWADPAPDGGPPNNWKSSFGGPAWTRDTASGQYYLHSFLAEQPDLNYRNPAVVAAMQEVLRFWLDRGVDGFRVDVIHKMIKDAALRDNPPLEPNERGEPREYLQREVYNHDRPEVHEIVRGWRRLLDGYGERMTVGEVFLFDPERLAAYYGDGSDELHLAFNFAFMWCKWDAAAFRARVEEMERLLPHAQPTYVLSSHDAPRHRGRFDHALLGEARARVAALMLLTLRGTPFVYYGEELGMDNVAVPSERERDPVAKTIPGFGRDPERTPMQWSAAPGAGFTAAADAWLPIGDCAAINAERQRDDPTSLLSFYRRLIWYRKRCAPLTEGAYATLPGPADTFAYERSLGSERVWIVLSFADEPRRFPLPAPGRIELSTNAQRDGQHVSVLDLSAAEGVILRPV